MEDEIMKELHDIRAEIAKEHDNDPQKINAFYESLRFPGFTYGIPGRTFQTEDELDEYIEERNKEYESRKARKAASDGVRPPKPCVKRGGILGQTRRAVWQRCHDGYG